ncbi:oxidoreductase [Apiospora marii]|uniref:oxidoreductase n=1 Tax=Apiospora marii TaxID=335849 RepID=UPI003131B256
METSYDFIIVGGGTSGLVLANRLSADATIQVLVLEAGSDHSKDPRVQTPALYQSVWGSELDWDLHSVPQPGLNGRTINLYQGKTLGGSSATNAHIFAPPNWDLIDTWDSVLGNVGWNRKTLQKYFTRTFTSPSVASSDEELLGVDRWPSNNRWAPHSQDRAETFRSTGHYMPGNPLEATTGDGRNDDPVGSFSCLSSIHPTAKERCCSASAYYVPVKSRPNLRVLTNAFVDKVMFDNSNSDLPRAMGVRFVHDGIKRTITAKKEVILAAGALQSPKILELSGIGNREILQEHGIEVVKDLPAVGENLQDHPITGICFEAVDSLETLDGLLRQDPVVIQQAMHEYSTDRTGLLTSIGMHTYAYMPLVSVPGRQAVASLLQANMPSTWAANGAQRAYHDIARQNLLSPTKPSAAYLSVVAQQDLPSAGPAPGKFLTLGMYISQPLSRGHVHIRSADPSAPPGIDPQYLTHPVDVEVMAQHLLFLNNVVAHTPPLRGLLKTPLKHRDPASASLDNGDVAAAADYARGSAISMFHYVGTCAMLPAKRGGVVDTALKVYGVAGLRVVDASVIPLITTGNTQSMVYAIAERAADLVREEYGLGA